MTARRLKIAVVPIVAAVVIVAAVLLARPRVEPPPEPPKPGPVEPGKQPEKAPKPEPPKAAILRQKVEEPPLEGKNLEIYHRARQVLLVNPREFQQFISLFRRDPETWKESMKHMAATDPQARPRSFALRVLMEYKDPGLEPLFRERLERDDFHGARCNAAEALGKLPRISAESRDALRKAGDSDPVESVRAAAKQALEKHP
ncbi:MAG: HEAT repeat domain-containing protein [Planctomycetota bacterium]|jgi:hypothetical protein